ncbi:MAG: hypothetical protein R3D59_19095 [Paracoccaceae bacterium]
MPAASSGLMFLNGLRAIAEPLATGWAMETMGPNGFFAYLAVAFGSLLGPTGSGGPRSARPVGRQDLSVCAGFAVCLAGGHGPRPKGSMSRRSRKRRAPPGRTVLNERAGRG